MDEISCSVPFPAGSRIVLGHGAGGRMTQRLIRELFLHHLGDPSREGHDSEVVMPETAKMALTTDAFVVKPIFFPGGDIGSLSIHGTVNDLAMSGAIPRFFTASFILEEGFSLDELSRLLQSMKTAALENGLRLVAGDTKVVERGKGDGVFVSLTGLGEIRHDLDIHPRSIRSGDVILCSGDLGRHAISILNAREKLFPDNEIVSDSASLLPAVRALLEDKIPLHCARDITRGGLATALVELAESSGLGFSVEDAAMEVPPIVQSACDLMGLDPLYLANEGRFVAFVPEEAADRALDILRRVLVSSRARIIGRVLATFPRQVILRTPYGTERSLDRLNGEMLPRIC